MTSWQKRNQAHQEPISVIKIRSITSSNKKENIKQLYRLSNERQRLSSDFCLSGNFSTELANTTWKQPKSSRFEKYFKKELRTHEINFKKNPRINLIQNTQRIISNNNNHSRIQKFVLHSTKKLQIMSENYQHSRRESQQKYNRQVTKNNNTYFISIMSDRDQLQRQTPVKDGEGRERRSLENQRVCKGTTMKKRQISNNLTARISASAELEKRYTNKNNNKSDHQNEQETAQQSKLSLYQSLIYTRKLKAQNVGMPFMQSSFCGDDTKIDRSRFLDSQIEKKHKNNRSIYHEQKERDSNHQQFPRKKIDGNSPQVLTIHLKRPSHTFRGALTQKFDRREHYQPRSLQLGNGFRRPNTTVNDRSRNDSEIQPW